MGVTWGELAFPSGDAEIVGRHVSSLELFRFSREGSFCPCFGGCPPWLWVFWKLVWERELGKSSCHSGRRTSPHHPRQTQCLIHFPPSWSAQVRVSLGAFLQRVDSSWQGSGMGRAQRSSVRFSCSVVSPWTAACQASLSITNSRIPPKPMSIESVMPSNHLILCVPFSSCPQSFPASVSVQMSQRFSSGGQSIGVSASTSVLPMNIQD